MGHNMKKQLILLFTLTLVATFIISACSSPEQATTSPTQTINTIKATEPAPPTVTSEPDPCAPENIPTRVEEVHKLMREFGFPPDQLFRAIVRRDRDRANHMVTLWFEDRDDPWVIDAIGAVTSKVRRFSDLSGWTPTKVFNEREQYTPTR